MSSVRRRQVSEDIRVVSLVRAEGRAKLLALVAAAALLGCSSADLDPAPESSFGRQEQDAPGDAPQRGSESLDEPPGSGSESTASPEPLPPAFVAGDAFDYSRFPQQTQMVATMLDVFAYASSTAPKAVAVNGDGLGYVAVRPGATQDEVELVAKQGCFVIGGAKPCALLARLDSFAVGLNTLSFDYVMAKPTATGELPFVTPAVAAEAIKAYQSAPNPKAIAIGLDGTIGNGFAETSGQLRPANGADARRVALERCEMQSRFAPCTLFASAGTVTFDPVAPGLEPVIDYGRRRLENNLPGAVAGAWSIIQSDYLPKLANGSGAIFLSRRGAGGYYAGASSATAAENEALKLCNDRALGEPCFQYATNRNIVFGTKDLRASAPGTVALHCKAVPRASCAAHRAMGCTASGPHYVRDAQTVKLEACVF
jgi:hypothetical protein